MHINLNKNIPSYIDMLNKTFFKWFILKKKPSLSKIYFSRISLFIEVISNTKLIYWSPEKDKWTLGFKRMTISIHNALVYTMKSTFRSHLEEIKRAFVVSEDILRAITFSNILFCCFCCIFACVRLYIKN